MHASKRLVEQSYEKTLKCYAQNFSFGRKLIYYSERQISIFVVFHSCQVQVVYHQNKINCASSVPRGAHIKTY